MAGTQTVTVSFNAVTSGFEKSLSNLQNSISRTTSSFGSFAASIAKLGGTYFAISSLKELGTQFIETGMQYEKLEATLKAVAPEHYKEIFTSLQEFAKQTPYDTEQAVVAWTRLVNLGLDPSTKALKAFGNIAAATPNKTLVQFVEALADATVGEFVRLKEFGIKARQLGTDGKKIAITFQGLTKTIDNTADSIQEYITKVAAGVANGNAMEEQTKTLKGRMEALGDSIKQLMFNVNKSTGALNTIGLVINQVADKVTEFNDVFKADAAQNYFDAFKYEIEPISNLFDSIGNSIANLAGSNKTFSQMMSEDWTNFVTNIQNATDGVLDFSETMSVFLDNNGLELFFTAATDAIQPLNEELTNLGNSISEFFSNILSGSDESETEFTGSMDSMSSSADFNWRYIPSYIAAGLETMKNYIVAFGVFAVKYFNQVWSTIKSTFNPLKGGIAGLIKDNLTTPDNLAGSSAFSNTAKLIQETNEQFLVDQKISMTKIAQQMQKSDSSYNLLSKQWEESKAQAGTNRLLDGILSGIEKEKGNTKIVNKLIDNLVDQEDPLTKYSPKFEKSSDLPDKKAKKKKGRSGKSAADKEAKESIDYQEKLQDEMYRRGEISAQTYYDNLLNLRLKSIKSENTEVSKQYQKNLDIINSSSSTEEDKQKAIKANQILQSQMNNVSSKELSIRQEISKRLADANEEYQKNISDIEKQINILSIGGETAVDAMKEFDDKYKELTKRIKAEDEASGKRDQDKLARLRALTEAQAKINELQNSVGINSSELDARKAEIAAQEAGGVLSAYKARQLEYEESQKLNKSRLEYLNNELKIAQATPGFSQEKINNIRKEIAETQKDINTLPEDVQTIYDGMSDGFSTFFNSILNGTSSLKDAFKDLGSSIVQTINDVISKQLGNALVESLFGSATSSGTSSGGGLFSSLSGLFTNTISGLAGYATGGVMKPGELAWVGENGPELIRAGAGNTRVFNERQSSKMSSGQSVINNNFSINTPNYNSFNKSQDQLLRQSYRATQRSLSSK